MIAIPRQGEIWWAETDDQHRSALVVTRSEAIPFLTAKAVAPVTRAIRDIPSEVRLGADENLEVECSASFDNLQRVMRSALTRRIGNLRPGSSELCRAMQAIMD